MYCTITKKKKSLINNNMMLLIKLHLFCGSDVIFISSFLNTRNLALV